MRLLSLIKPSASAILIGACLAVTACERPAFMDDKRSSQTQRVAVRLVYDPLLRAYLRQSKKAFEKEVPTVSGGRRVELELIEMPALRAAKELASGKLKVEAWLAPSQALINYTNAHLINLGAPQTDCTHLFRSPYVLATRREDILELGAQAQLSWPYVASIINTSKGPGRAPILMHTHPLRAISGPGNLIQLAGLAFKQQDAPLSVADFEKGSQGLDQLRSIENMVSSYGDNDQDLLKRAEKPSSVFRPLVLTTEQQMVQFNLSSNPPLAAIYLSEGSAWQEYALCRSDADWVTPDRRIALELFSDFLSTPASQMEARQLGFRPALLDVAPVHPLTRELGVRLDLPKRSLAAPTGEFTAKLLESWPKLQRPLAIIFVVDASGSMQGGPLDITRQSIGGLISRLSDTDLTALISFSTNAQEVSPLSSKHQETIQKLNSLEAAGGSAFYDAVNMGIQLINQEDLKKFRKNLIVVVDGPDRNSSTNLPLLTSAINNTATRRDLNLTIIGITGQGLEQTVISEIAQAAGGTVKTTSPAALNETCEEIWKSM